MIYKRKWPAAVFLLPAFVFMVIFLFYPFIRNIIDSFFNVSQLGAPHGAFIGAENYLKIIPGLETTDPNMVIAVKNTLLLMACTIVFQVGIALVLALMVDTIQKGSQVFRILFFFPIVVSATALGLLFNLMLMTRGPINQLIESLGGTRIIFKEQYTFLTMAIPVVWQYVGFYFVILVTGLNNISEDVKEAAEIDGATGFKRIRYITLPLHRRVHRGAGRGAVSAEQARVPREGLLERGAVMKIGRKRIYPSHVLIYILLSLWALTTVFPFLWVLISSFKNKDIIQTDAFSLRFAPTLDNYVKTFTKPPQSVWMAYFNSILISGVVTVLVVLLAGMAAFAMVRYRFRGRRFLDSLIIASLMFPVFSTIIPVFQMLSAINVTDSPVGVILPQIAGNLSFAMVILMGYIRSLPVDLEESAFLEGCNVFQVFYKVILPVCRPAFATVAIFSFLWSYNDLFTQLFFLRSPEKWTITRFLNEVSSQFGTDYGMMCAVVTLIFVPVMIVYVFLQKNIIKGLTAGAIKG